MNPRRLYCSGVVDPITLGVLTLIVGFFAGSWKPLNMFHKSPPVEQLRAAQVDLEKAKAAAAAHEAALLEQQKRERNDLESQIRAAQQMNAGAALVLGRVKDPDGTIRLASSFVVRANVRLAAAIGKLPQDQQDEVLTLIDQLLSGAQAQVDAANAKLADKDAEFKVIVADRDAAKIETIKQQQLVAQNRVVVEQKDGEVKNLTGKIADWAQKTDQAERKAGSLGATLDKLFHLALLIGIIYIFLSFGLPGIIKHLEDGWMKRGLRDVSGYLTNPLLYHDARKKIASLAKEPTQ